MTSNASPPGPPGGRDRRPPTIDLNATEVEAKPDGAAATGDGGPNQSCRAPPEARASPRRPNAATGNGTAGRTPNRTRAGRSPLRLAARGPRLAAAQCALAPDRCGGRRRVVCIALLIAGPAAATARSALDARLARVEQPGARTCRRGRRPRSIPRPSTICAPPRASSKPPAAPRPPATDPALANRISNRKGTEGARRDGRRARAPQRIATIARERRARGRDAAALAELAKRRSRAPAPRRRLSAASSTAMAGRARRRRAQRRKRSRPSWPSARHRRADRSFGAARGGRRRAQGRRSSAAIRSPPSSQRRNRWRRPQGAGAARAVRDLRRARRPRRSLANCRRLRRRSTGRRRRAARGGFLERLQANAEKLVRIRPIEEVAGRRPRRHHRAHRAWRRAQPMICRRARRACEAAGAVRRRRGGLDQGEAEARNAAVEASRRFAADALARARKVT